MKQKPCGSRNAQLSLEYLLLLAAFFSVLLLMLPLIQRTYSLALFGFDVRQAASFSKQFSESAKQLSILSDESALSIGIVPLHDWRIAVQGSLLVVSVHSTELKKTKNLETALVSDFLGFEKTFNEKAVILLKKENGNLIIDSYP